MFCTSLRKRPEWSSVPPRLLSQQQPKWLEQTLATHDLAIPLPQPQQRDRKEFFRIILLSTVDMQDLSLTMGRIERLYHQTGGRNVGILFLIKSSKPTENGTMAFMKLQAELLSTFEIPALPLNSISGLQSTLFAFQRQIVQSQKSTPSQSTNPINALLPFCSMNTPIPEHARNILSDLCHSIPELAQAATTRDGQEEFSKWLTDQPQVLADVVGFWEQEYIVD